MSIENVEKQTPKVPEERFLHFLKYEKCIYVLAFIGAISQMAIVAVIIAHLVTGLRISDQDLEDKGITYSAIGILVLTGTSFSEILLMRAINQRFLRYIQWWMMSSFIIFIFSVLMTVISAFTLYLQALWITLGFVYVVIRLPFQIHFVDKFAHAEIIHKEPHMHNLYKSVLYHRFH